MSVGGPPLTERYPELSASSRSWRSHEQRPELLPRRLMSTGATGGMLYTWYWADCCSVDEGPPLGASSMQRAATIKAVAGARRRGCRGRGAWCRLPDQPSARAPINGRERRCTCPPVACWATARPSPTGIAARTPPSCRVSPDAWRHSQKPVWQVRRLPQHPAPAPGRQTRVGHQNHSSSHPPCHWPEQLAHVNRLFMWLGCCIGGSDSPEAMVHSPCQTACTVPPVLRRSMQHSFRWRPLRERLRRGCGGAPTRTRVRGGPTRGLR